MVSARDRDDAKLTGSLSLNAPNNSKPLASSVVGKKNKSQKKKTKSKGKMTRAQKKRTRSQKKKSKSQKKKANSQEKKTKSPEKKINLNSERPGEAPELEPAGQGYLALDEFSLRARIARRFPLPAYLESGPQFDFIEIICPICKQRRRELRS
ncbi:unnamed protein product [Clonostachys solani]|uniref:Uncharacterized protein n=1 Tax=Clonostachys solani TaxID=160281 RepID=A0A9N9WC62_9HYPO|nr:unnamed protein product [Clonostachys solani]